MTKATLVIMAAGIGSRFGCGIKQLETMGPNGEIIMDYSIYDAKEAGFEKVVFVIRKDLEEDFREVIGKRIEEKIEVEYVFQELDKIPEAYKDAFPDRKKPWGTGQAVLCCKEVVDGPFLVINADDYYGKEAFVQAYRYLMKEEKDSERLQIAMVGFVLGNTLSDHGSVTRGVCKADIHTRDEKYRPHRRRRCFSRRRKMGTAGSGFAGFYEYVGAAPGHFSGAGARV